MPLGTFGVHETLLDHDDSCVHPGVAEPSPQDRDRGLEELPCPPVAFKVSAPDGPGPEPEPLLHFVGVLCEVLVLRGLGLAAFEHRGKD